MSQPFRILECKRCLLLFDVNDQDQLIVVWARGMALHPSWKVEQVEACPDCRKKAPRNLSAEIQQLIEALDAGYEYPHNKAFIEDDGFMTVYPPVSQKTQAPEPTCHICGRDVKVCRVSGEFCGWSL